MLPFSPSNKTKIMIWNSDNYICTFGFCFHPITSRTLSSRSLIVIRISNQGNVNEKTHVWSRRRRKQPPPARSLTEMFSGNHRPCSSIRKQLNYPNHQRRCGEPSCGVLRGLPWFPLGAGTTTSPGQNNAPCERTVYAAAKFEM